MHLKSLTSLSRDEQHSCNSKLGLEHLACKGKAERSGVVQHGEEKALGVLSFMAALGYLKRKYKKDGERLSPVSL